MNKECMPERSSHLEVTTLAGEVMVYNETTEAAYCLNETAGKVLLACDGATSKSEVVRQLGGVEHSADLLEVTLCELAEQGLLQQNPPSAGLSRRDFLSTWGKLAAALPVIAYVAAPDAAHAQSGVITTTPPL